MEYLVNMTTHVPEGTPDRAVADIRSREAAHSSELAAADDAQLEQVLASMPLRVW